MTDHVLNNADYGGSIRAYRSLGLRLILTVTVSFGVWGGLAPLAGAVVSSGQFEVDGNIKKVQHQTGGVVSEILVHEGQRVSAGQVLLRLDGTVAKSNAQVIENQLDQLTMNVSMLEAQRDGAEQFTLPAYFGTRGADPSVAGLYRSELARLETQRKARLGQQQQLRQQITQFNSQIDGMAQQLAAKTSERKLLDGELIGLNDLLAKKLVQVSQVNDLKRQGTEVDGAIGQLEASTAELRGKIAEKELQILNIDQQASADASNAMREAENKIDELTQRQIEARDQLDRLDIRSPIAGIVHELSVHTVGGVIGAGEALMMIVPEAADLNIQVKISPRDIESVHVGDKASIRVVGLNRSTTPELKADVDLVGADLVQDPDTHMSYYPVRLSLGSGEVNRLHGKPLIPGMPVEVFITTSARTFFQYLSEPFLDRISRAIREQ